MKALDQKVTVTVAAYQWLQFLGYLSGVGVGDELEMYRWIASQLNEQLREREDEAVLG
jgi:hypothetical protein